MTTPQQIEAKAQELRLKIITCKEADDHAVIGDFLTSFAAELRNDVLEEANRDIDTAIGYLEILANDRSYEGDRLTSQTVHPKLLARRALELITLKSDTTKGEQL